MKRCLHCSETYQREAWICPRCGSAPEMEDGFPIFAPDLAVENNTYTVDFFVNLAKLEQGHFWFEARNQLLLRVVQQYFPGDRKILEVGCGTGFVLQNFALHLPEIEPHGSDLLVAGLRFAKQRVPTATLIQMDVRDIPFSCEFDVIGAFDVIEHVQEDDLALRQMYYSLKPGGGLIITVPQHQFLWSVIDDMSYHKRRYSKHELLAKVQGAGFKVLMTTSFVSLLLPLMMLARFRKSTAGDNFDLYAEFKLNPMLNKLFSLVMAIEVAMIRAGLSFRFGGSRLLIAMRPDE